MDSAACSFHHLGHTYGPHYYQLHWRFRMMNKDFRISPHFWLGEFVRSDTACRQNIDNVLRPEVNHHDALVVINLMRLCNFVLEPLRQHFGQPIRINSGYRCPALNAAIKGSAKNSLHMQGRAVDIPMHPAWFAYIRDHLPHTELINEGSWIHVAL